MEVNSTNYEQFVIDYVEGTLSTEQNSSMNAFLVEHPELKKEIESLKDIILTPEPIVYPNKAELKKKRPPLIAIPSSWYKSGIAAVLGGLIALTSYKMFIDNSKNSTSASAEVTVTDPLPPSNSQAVLPVAAGEDVQAETETITVETTPVVETTQPAQKAVVRQVSAPKQSASETTLVESVESSPAIETIEESSNREQIVIRDIQLKLPETPSTITNREKTLIASANTTASGISIGQFDLNQMLDVQSDYGNTPSPVPTEEAVRFNGFEIDSFVEPEVAVASDTDEDLPSVMQKSRKTKTKLKGEKKNRLLPRSFGLTIQKKAIDDQ